MVAAPNDAEWSVTEIRIHFNQALATPATAYTVATDGSGDVKITLKTSNTSSGWTTEVDGNDLVIKAGSGDFKGDDKIDINASVIVAANDAGNKNASAINVTLA